jgi:hypothetical protein
MNRTNGETEEQASDHGRASAIRAARCSGCRDEGEQPSHRGIDSAGAMPSEPNCYGSDIRYRPETTIIMVPQSGLRLNLSRKRGHVPLPLSRAAIELRSTKWAARTRFSQEVPASCDAHQERRLFPRSILSWNRDRSQIRMKGLVNPGARGALTCFPRADVGASCVAFLNAASLRFVQEHPQRTRCPPRASA